MFGNHSRANPDEPVLTHLRGTGDACGHQYCHASDRTHVHGLLVALYSRIVPRLQPAFTWPRNPAPLARRTAPCRCAM